MKLLTEVTAAFVCEMSFYLCISVECMYLLDSRGSFCLCVRVIGEKETAYMWLLCICRCQIGIFFCESEVSVQQIFFLFYLITYAIMGADCNLFANTWAYKDKVLLLNSLKPTYKSSSIKALLSDMTATKPQMQLWSIQKYFILDWKKSIIVMTEKSKGLLFCVCCVHLWKLDPGSLIQCSAVGSSWSSW